MSWDRVRGQSAAIGLLRQAAAVGRLPHAMLFIGPAGVGKTLVARELAAALLCERSSDVDLAACGTCGSCRMLAAGTHPDFLSVALPEGKSQLPLDLIVGSIDNRGREGLCHDLALRPMAGDRRVALIEDADRMNADSANALLKTLEEPPPYATIILISDEIEQILPTIRSRCQAIRFGPLPEEDVAALIQQLEWTADSQEAVTVASMSDGSLAVAGRLLDPKLRALRDNLFAGLAQPKLQPRALAKSLLESLEEIGGDNPTQRETARWIVRFLVDFLRQSVRAVAGQVSSSNEVTQFTARLDADDPATIDRISATIDRCVDADEQISGNASIPLCVEGLISDVVTLLEPAPAR